MLLRRDETRAHVAEVETQDLRRRDGPTVGDTPGHHHRSVMDRADTACECEGIGPAGLSARTARQQDQAVRPCGDGLLRMPHGGHIGPDLPAIVTDTVDDRCRAAHAGDDDLRPVAADDLQIIGESAVGAVNNQVRHHRSSRRTRGSHHLRHPVIQLFHGPAIGRRKRSHDAGLNRRNHKLRPGNKEHRSRDHGYAHRSRKPASSTIFSISPWIVHHR